VAVECGSVVVNDHGEDAEECLDASVLPRGVALAVIDTHTHNGHHTRVISGQRTEHTAPPLDVQSCRSLIYLSWMARARKLYDISL